MSVYLAAPPLRRGVRCNLSRACPSINQRHSCWLKVTTRTLLPTLPKNRICLSPVASAGLFLFVATQQFLPFYYLHSGGLMTHLFSGLVGFIAICVATQTAE